MRITWILCAWTLMACLHLSGPRLATGGESPGSHPDSVAFPSPEEIGELLAVNKIDDLRNFRDANERRWTARGSLEYFTWCQAFIRAIGADKNPTFERVALGCQAFDLAMAKEVPFTEENYLATILQQKELIGVVGTGINVSFRTSSTVSEFVEVRSQIMRGIMVFARRVNSGIIPDFKELEYSKMNVLGGVRRPPEEEKVNDENGRRNSQQKILRQARKDLLDFVFSVRLPVLYARVPINYFEVSDLTLLGGFSEHERKGLLRTIAEAAKQKIPAGLE